MFHRGSLVIVTSLTIAMLCLRAQLSPPQAVAISRSTRFSHTIQFSGSLGPTSLRVLWFPPVLRFPGSSCAATGHRVGNPRSRHNDTIPRDHLTTNPESTAGLRLVAGSWGNAHAASKAVLGIRSPSLSLPNPASTLAVQMTIRETR